ncbi:adenine-specific DNA-methyltransferase [Myroides odoratimimus CCUG 12700]|uniref:site-specific DNA-methyltransferase n=1 Tax=Myroides odoratimimus TaxID=76832 RepID=UPI0003529265|nr:site-specific DNA-methyltransferase [Myroides odoratimimus]EPH12278.1 adenine-specific DNA-methyltransferase [Myroides odoratimimus CCUG 12700]
MEKINELTSENIVQKNIERLKEIFPTAFSEGKLVVEELQALVGEYIEKDKEFYQMTWVGKTAAKREANKVSTGTLRPNKADSKDWDTTGNIFIEGDNLEVLKLLQKSYSNKIKMIYIDPPYNTGNDFVYEDDFKDNLKNYLELTGQTDEEGKKFSTNTDSNGRFHSKWLNNMYMRLKLARNLMAEDGVIFISIDDNEQANLKKVCDEIFGEENTEMMIWNKEAEGASGTLKTTLRFRKIHEYLIVCYKNIDEVLFSKINEALKGKENELQTANLAVNEGNQNVNHENYFDIVNPKGKVFSKQWKWSKDKINQLIEDDLIYWGSDGNKQPRLIIPTDERRTTYLLSILNYGGTTVGRKDYENLMNNIEFSYPKPIILIKKILQTVTDKHKASYVLDFFAGSGSTNQAVMSLNAEDGGDRKCISVQLPETTKEDSEAYKAGYKNIAEITKERIRRAGELIKQENKDKEHIGKLDIGFRAFKLDSSNIRAWDTAVANFEGQLDAFEAHNGDSIKSDRTEEDVLFEILLKYGLDLTLPIQERIVAGSTIYNIGFGAMYICLSDAINVDVAKAIGEWHKESSDDKPSVIFKDAGFANDADKTNTVQMLRQAGIENVKSI